MNQTINKTDLKDFFISHFNSSKKDFPLKSLSERREKAFAIFEKEGFPTTKNEEWKYTNVAPILKKEYNYLPSSSISKKDIEDYFVEGLKASICIFINGVFSPEFSTILDKNIIIQNFSEAQEEDIAKYFDKDIHPANAAFTALNTAFAENGAYIKIPKGTVVEHPIILHFIADAKESNAFIQPRNLVIAEENSQVELVELVTTAGNHNSFTNIVTEVVLKENAIVHYYKIQNDSQSQVNTTQIYQQEKSSFYSITISLDGELIRNNLNVDLNAENSEAFLYGLYFLKDKQHTDNHTLVNHAKPNCYSNELYKGVLTDKSRGVFNGKIFVKPDAQKTNAFQSNKNILLSPDAIMDTKPQLEIYADDVKCSHGATVGKMDEEPLFYLRSRGISENAAKALLVNAFANDILEHIKIDVLKDKIEHVISTRLLV